MRLSSSSFLCLQQKERIWGLRKTKKRLYCTKQCALIVWGNPFSFFVNSVQRVQTISPRYLTDVCEFVKQILKNSRISCRRSYLNVCRVIWHLLYLHHATSVSLVLNATNTFIGIIILPSVPSILKKVAFTSHLIKLGHKLNNSLDRKSVV